ncbi:HAD family hydrolase [Streptomyces sp. NPDC127069]|uniref:HAD family hydrolase n=1 Tax=Streptomyces sp. NPDC127069 TaxID=3347128 RepID=UPI0036616D70
MRPTAWGGSTVGWGHVAEIVGRPVGRPDLMKPNPFPIIRAAERAGVGVADCTLIGDSLTDVQAAHAAGATVVAYANKPHKAALFAEAGADTITDTMHAIAEALTTAQP